MAFPSTQWSLILATADSAGARLAWQELAERYRPAIVGFCIARFGRERAEDLAQQFFLESIAQSWWARADQARGSFRTYLRVLLTRFGERHGDDYHYRAEADPAQSEREAVDDAHALPERRFDACFAAVLIESARRRLLAESDDQQHALAALLVEKGEHGELKRLAEAWQISENTAAQKLKRLRQRFRELLRAEIVELVDDPARADQELSEFLAVLRD